jgi:uncharacterized membrane protein
LGFLSREKIILLKLIYIFSGVGFVASLYLVYLQLFVIEAICVYCMFSALMTTLIFILSGWYYHKSIKNKSINSLN